ncbi:MAG: PASTA domain-containing protein [Clostridia bacterium]|nr:PASTA domain-containing protein [Clostridia bacterium]
MAAPVGGKVLSEILPYLDLQKDNVTEEEMKQEIEVPKIEKMTIEEATKVLKEKGLEMQIENSPENLDKKTTIIQEQIPKQGIKVYEGTKIIVKI